MCASFWRPSLCDITIVLNRLFCGPNSRSGLNAPLVSERLANIMFKNKGGHLSKSGSGQSLSSCFPAHVRFWMVWVVVWPHVSIVGRAQGASKYFAQPVARFPWYSTHSHQNVLMLCSVSNRVQLNGPKTVRGCACFYRTPEFPFSLSESWQCIVK